MGTKISLLFLPCSAIYRRQKTGKTRLSSIFNRLVYSLLEDRPVCLLRCTVKYNVLLTSPTCSFTEYRLSLSQQRLIRDSVNLTGRTDNSTLVKLFPPFHPESLADKYRGFQSRKPSSRKECIKEARFFFVTSIGLYSLPKRKKKGEKGGINASVHYCFYRGRVVQDVSRMCDGAFLIEGVRWAK